MTASLRLLCWHQYNFVQIDGDWRVQRLRDTKNFGLDVNILAHHHHFTIESNGEKRMRLSWCTYSANHSHWLLTKGPWPSLSLSQAIATGLQDHNIVLDFYDNLLYSLQKFQTRKSIQAFAIRKMYVNKCMLIKHIIIGLIKFLVRLELVLALTRTNNNSLFCVFLSLQNIFIEMHRI